LFMFNVEFSEVELCPGWHVLDHEIAGT